MKIEIEGLKELIAECERICTPREIEEADKRALKRCGDMAKAEVKKLMPRSQDVTRSGRKGSRTYKHAADNIPMKIKKIDGKLGIIVGWDKSADDSYFYVKFYEFDFGTSDKKPIAMFKKTFIKQRDEWNKVFVQEYEKLIEGLK